MPYNTIEWRVTKMETKEYIDNRINTKINEYNTLSKHYKKCHIAMIIGIVSCILSSVLVLVLYFVLDINWLVFAGIVLNLASIFLLMFNLVCQYEKRSVELKCKAENITYEKNVYLVSNSDFSSRCERNLD